MVLFVIIYSDGIPVDEVSVEIKNDLWEAVSIYDSKQVCPISGGFFSSGTPFVVKGNAYLFINELIGALGKVERMRRTFRRKHGAQFALTFGERLMEQHGLVGTVLLRYITPSLSDS